MVALPVLSVRTSEAYQLFRLPSASSFYQPIISRAMIIIGLNCMAQAMKWPAPVLSFPCLLSVIPSFLVGNPDHEEDLDRQSVTPAKAGAHVDVASSP